MKRILTLITAFTLVFTACEGPQGPPGFDGFDGQDGEIIASSAFEIVVDFNAANNYEFIEPYGFEVLPTDVTLVYIVWDTLEDGTEIWRLLPQTVIFEDGNDLVYNFDFTQTDVRFFLEGSDLDGLADVWTQNQIFRVVVVPADNVGRIDYTDINNVMETYNIESFPRR